VRTLLFLIPICFAAAQPRLWPSDSGWMEMYDLQVAAFQGDLTRVATLVVGREGSPRSYPEIGIPEQHHPLTHHGGLTAAPFPTATRILTRICRCCWRVEAEGDTSGTPLAETIGDSSGRVEL
jgi:hypothetical protein